MFTIYLSDYARRQAEFAEAQRKYGKIFTEGREEYEERGMAELLEWSRGALAPEL